LRESVVLTFFILCFLLLVWVMYYFIIKGRAIEKRINYYFDLENNGKRQSERKLLIKDSLSSDKFSSFKRINEGLRKKISSIDHKKLEEMIKSSGIQLNTEEFVMIRWFIAVITGGLLSILFNSLLFLLVGIILGYISTNLWLKRKIRLRIEAFNKGLPDMISTIIGSLRSGYSFTQAFKTVVEECDTPVKDEVQYLLKELNYGVSMEEALNNLNFRVPSKDLELMVQAVLIQRQVGGNLAGVLEIILGTIRERARIQRQVQTLTAQGRLSGKVIGALPLVLGFMIYLINPEYMKVLFTNTVGIIIISIGGISGFIGFIIIHKLTEVEV